MCELQGDPEVDVAKFKVGSGCVPTQSALTLRGRRQIYGIFST